MDADLPQSGMLPKCPFGECKFEKSLLATELIDHLIEFHKTKKLFMDCPMITFDVECKERDDKDSYSMTVPFIFQYDGLHFIFVVNFIKDRYHFWVYFVEDGSMSEGRCFYGYIFLHSQSKTMNMRESQTNVIHPITTLIDIPVKQGGTFSMHNKAFRKHFLAADNHFTMDFILNEMDTPEEASEQDIPNPTLLVESTVDETVSDDDSVYLTDATQKFEDGKNDESLIIPQPQEEPGSSDSSVPKSIEATSYAFCVELTCSKCQNVITKISTNCDVTVKAARK